MNKVHEDTFPKYYAFVNWLLQSPGGVLEVYMTGGSDIFFWVENLYARYFLGSRDLSRIFLGLISERTFRFGFSLRSVDQENIHLNFFSAMCVPCSCIFLGWKF